jgi:predicted Zn finger-like uncharacterized protein
MRLTCPNCGAEYEVPDDAIPEAGRDVQCSNCGHTWFETGAAEQTQAEDPPDPPAPRPPARAPSTVPAATGTAAAADRDGAVPDPDAPHPGRAAADPEAPHPDPGQPAPRRRLDPAVASVLREERETSEALRRKASPAPMERQEDLPLTEPPRARQVPVEPAAARRERLPDVDAINRTLEDAGAPASAARTPSEQAARRYRRGVRYGFALIALPAALASLIYLYAPAIGEAVPALAAPLAAYDATIDSLRLSLDSAVRALTARLSDSDPG